MNTLSRFRWLAPALVGSLLLLTACGPAPAPTPAVRESFPTPASLPSPVLRTPTPTRTHERATVVATASQPQTTPTADPQSPPQTAATSTPVRLAGALVSASQAALYAAPNGQRIASIPAGTRLGLLARTPDNRWLAVRYQPDPDSPVQQGWVQASALAILTDLNALAVATDAQAFVAAEPDASPPRPTQAPIDAEGVAATVLADRLNLRAGPGANQAVVGSLTGGMQVAVLGRTDDGAWYQVQTASGLAGWAAARYLQLGDDSAVIPITGASLTSVPAPTRNSGGGSTGTGGGRIVFQTNNGGDIYIIDADGTGLRRLTRGFDPALSPDGRQVAFTRWDEPRGLWVINSDGTGERQLISANEPRSPTWTPAGTALVFEQTTGSVACRQTPFGCVSEEQIDAIFGGADCIDTPFGRMCKSDFPLASQPLSGLLSYDLTTGNSRDLPAATDMRAPSHAAQGNNVVVLERGGYSVVQSQGNDPPARVVALQVPLGPADFSPDGRYIYGSRLSADHWDIWRWNADGSDETALTAPPGLRDRPIHSVAPTVSPDGRSVLFLTDRRGPWELWLMDADGGNQRPFASAALAGIEFRYDFSADRVADWAG